MESALKTKTISTIICLQYVSSCNSGAQEPWKFDMESTSFIRSKMRLILAWTLNLWE